jgi:hypothetical protein
MCPKVYVNASALLITADGGGSNGARNRVWKVSLQSFADTTSLVIHVCRLSPGTSKWNKIEHRLFSQSVFNRNLAQDREFWHRDHPCPDIPIRRT